MNLTICVFVVSFIDSQVNLDADFIFFLQVSDEYFVNFRCRFDIFRASFGRKFWTHLKRKNMA